MWKTKGTWIVDEEGRSLIPRGINLGGSSKVPSRPDGSTFRRDGFYDTESVSFVGRPFPLEEADAHFSRLASWGQRFIRLIVTWEAVEHQGPGIYDKEYLLYLRALCERAQAHGLDIWVDPHQDAWSRWTGGDGAPAWTLRKAGFRLESLHASGAALLQQEAGDSYGRMVWSTNYNRLACATMFTLFFAGNRFAPGFLMDGIPAQNYLQSRYLDAMRRVARSLAGLENVKAFGVINEPSLGFIGLSDIRRLQSWMLRKGPMPNPLEAMAAGSGIPTPVDNWHIGLSGNRKAGKVLLNPGGVSAWEGECLWKSLGIWGMDGGKPRALEPGHFRAEGNLGEAFLRPFTLKVIDAVRPFHPGALFFLEGVPNAEHPVWTRNDPPVAVNASHWYDGLTYMTRRWHRRLGVDGRTFRISLGRIPVLESFRRQVGYWAGLGSGPMGADAGGIPTVMGEFGLPFDLSGGKAFRTGDFSEQEEALSAYYDAMDSNLVGATLWNYASDNSHAEGDRWNGEDFSVFCAEDGGARALKGFCRPYPARTAGTPLAFSFDRERGRVRYEFLADPGIAAATELFLPECHFPSGSWEASAAFMDGGSGGGITTETKGTTLLIRHAGLPAPRRIMVRVSRQEEK